MTWKEVRKFETLYGYTLTISEKEGSDEDACVSIRGEDGNELEFSAEELAHLFACLKKQGSVKLIADMRYYEDRYQNDPDTEMAEVSLEAPEVAGKDGHCGSRTDKGDGPSGFKSRSPQVGSIPTHCQSQDEEEMK